MAVLAVQEHRGNGAKLGKLKKRARDFRFCGARGPATETGNKDGTSGGVAVLTRTHVSVTTAPYFDAAVAPYRICATHVYWSIKNVVIIASVYLISGACLIDDKKA